MDAPIQPDATVGLDSRDPAGPAPGPAKLATDGLAPIWVERPEPASLGGDGGAWVRSFELEPSRAAPRDVVTGTGLGAIAADDRGIWICHASSHSLTRLDPETLEITAVQMFSCAPVAVAIGADAVWVACRNGWVFRLLESGSNAEGVARVGNGVRALAATDGRVWVLREGGQLTQLDPMDGEPIMNATLGRGTVDLAADQDAIWVARRSGKRLLRIDPRSGRTEDAVPLPGVPVALAIAAGRVWVACRRGRGRSNGIRCAIDAKTGDVAGVRSLPGRPRALMSGGGSIWVACDSPAQKRNGRIVQIDPRGDGDSLAEAQSGWPVDALAFTRARLLAAMSIPIRGACCDADVTLGVAAMDL